MASLSPTKSRATVSTDGQTAESTVDGGNKVSNTASASIPGAEATRNTGYGNMVSASLGSMPDKSNRYRQGGSNIKSSSNNQALLIS